MKCNVNRFKSEAEAIALATKVIEETVATIDFEEDVKHLLAIQEENEEHTMILLCCLCFDKVNNQIELRKIKDNIYSTSGSNMDLGAVQECIVVTLLKRAWEFLVDYTDKQIEFDKNLTKAFHNYSYKAMLLLHKAGLQ